MTFDQSGQLSTPSSPFTIDAQVGNGNKVSDLSIKIDPSQISQVNDGNTVAVKNIDGQPKGSLESFSIGSSGEVTGVYNNGDVRL